MSRMKSCLAACLALSLASLEAAQEPASLPRDKQQLAPLQTVVGSWRGVGQPRRGSSQGAWTEQCEWGWQFDASRASLVCRLSGNKYFSSFQLQAGSKPGQFVLLATPVASDAVVRRFAGEKVDDALVLSAEPADDMPARITLRLVAGGDRLLALYEATSGAGAFSRLAEVGSTRQGSSFAKASLGGPECVVTGGLGTIAVEHQGQKYFVCCTGCRDLFRDDPQRVLAEFQERKAAERGESKK